MGWGREAYKSKRRRARAEEARRGLCDGAEVSKLAEGGGRGKEKAEALRASGDGTRVSVYETDEMSGRQVTCVLVGPGLYYLPLKIKQFYVSNKLFF